MSEAVDKSIQQYNSTSRGRGHQTRTPRRQPLFDLLYCCASFPPAPFRSVPPPPRCPHCVQVLGKSHHKRTGIFMRWWGGAPHRCQRAHRECALQRYVGAGANAPCKRAADSLSSSLYTAGGRDLLAVIDYCCGAAMYQMVFAVGIPLLC